MDVHAPPLIGGFCFRRVSARGGACTRPPSAWYASTTPGAGLRLSLRSGKARAVRKPRRGRVPRVRASVSRCVGDIENRTAAPCTSFPWLYAPILQGRGTWAAGSTRNSNADSVARGGLWNFSCSTGPDGGTADKKVLFYGARKTRPPFGGAPCR